MTYKPYTVLLIMNYQKISHYFKLNKFSLNVKNDRNAFNSKTTKSSTNKLAIYVDNIEMVQVKKTNFIGVIINSKLNWINHIKTVSNKLSTNIGIIFNVRHDL